MDILYILLVLIFTITMFIIGIKLALTKNIMIKENTPIQIVIAISVNKLIGAIYIGFSIIGFILINRM